MTTSSAPVPDLAELYQNLQKTSANLQQFQELLTTDAKIAQTPKTLVWALNKAKLFRYVPRIHSEKQRRVPLLLVFAIMNRPYVLDLRPGHSFVEYMLGHGYDVFLLDWGVPGPEDSHLKFDDYTLEYLPRAVRKLKSVTGSDEFSLLGWCLGALICTMYASLRPDDGLKNLMLLTAPLDFGDQTAGGFSRWTSHPAFNADRIVDAFGNVPGEMIDYGAKTLRPVENFAGTFLNLWDNIGNPRVVESWHAMNTWVRDTIPMAGAAYRQLINDFYKENRLMEGKLTLRGEPVDLRRLRANLLTVIAEADHITPACQSLGAMDRVGSEDKEIFRVRGGHIGMMAGSGAEKNTWPHIESWLSARSQ